MEPQSPALQADSLPREPPGKLPPTPQNILIAQQTFCHLVVRTKLIFPGLFLFSLDYDCGLVPCEHVAANQKMETWSMKEVLAILPFIYSIFSRVELPLWIRTGYWEGVRWLELLGKIDLTSSWRIWLSTWWELKGSIRSAVFSISSPAFWSVGGIGVSWVDLAPFPC